MMKFAPLLLTSAFLVTAASGQQRPKLTGVSHLSVYTSDKAKAESFYVHDLGATKAPDPEDGAGVRYYFSPLQFVEVLPLPTGERDPKNRLHGTGYNVANAEAMRVYLGAHHVDVPPAIRTGPEGTRSFEVHDPEGNLVEFVQPTTQIASVQANRLSTHILHVGLIVHDPALEDTFYHTLLGFRPYWQGGMTDNVKDWIALQVPDGKDWVEYMVAKGPEKTGIPAAMSQDTAGVSNHFALGVPNIEKAYDVLYERDGLNGKHSPPQLGRDGKWQLNLYDPDGTRAELMEFQPTEKPCCSPLLLPSPSE